MKTVVERMDRRLAAAFPELRLCVRSEQTTLYLRLRPWQQAMLAVLAVIFVAWSFIASSLVVLHASGVRPISANALALSLDLEARLATLANERDQALAEAALADQRYRAAMDQVAVMQGELLGSRRALAELEAALDELQAVLRTRTSERDAARAALTAFEQRVTAEEQNALAAQLAETNRALDILAAGLRTVAQQREFEFAQMADLQRQAVHLALELRLQQERNQLVFSQIETALEAALPGFERAFRSVGLNPQEVLARVRASREGGGVTTPALLAALAGQGEDPEVSRAQSVLTQLDDLTFYQVAARRTPFAMPVRGGVRMTSGFGMRRDPLHGRMRMHAGIDWAGARGTPIHATADGVVVSAGRDGAYGNTVVIRHAFGIETVYAHLSSIAVQPGQRVSRGDRIGAMGATGRATGVHLHYEIRVGGRPINPLTYIRAAQHVL